MQLLKTSRIIFFYFLTVLCLSNCYDKEKPYKALFGSIELSYHNGGRRITSVYMDSSKKVYIAVHEFNKSEKYYEGTMRDSSFIWLNSRVNWFFTNKHPSVVGKPIPDCSIACLLIRSAHAEKQIMMYNNPELGKLDSIIHRLIDLNEYDLKASNDSLFKFISLEKIRLPPVIMETHVFIPPVAEKTITVTTSPLQNSSGY
jgi:hypothetical protein